MAKNFQYYMEKVTEIYFEEETSFENMIDEEFQSHFNQIKDNEQKKEEHSIMSGFITRSFDLGQLIDYLKILHHPLLEKIEMYKKRYNMKNSYKYPFQKRKEKNLINFEYGYKFN